MGIASDIDQYLAKLTAAVREGLDGGGQEFERAAEANARSRMRGVTGATFAGIATAVDGGDQSRVTQAVSQVGALNPNHVATDSSPAAPDQVVRLIGTVPTDYIDQLEARANKRFLGPTLDQEGTTIQRAIEAAAGRAT